MIRIISKIPSFPIFSSPCTNISLKFPVSSFYPTRYFSDMRLPSKEEITERVCSVIGKMPKINSHKITPNCHFSKDLGLDSLDIVELLMLFEEEFKNLEFTDEQLDTLHSVPQIVDLISKNFSSLNKATITPS